MLLVSGIAILFPQPANEVGSSPLRRSTTHTTC